MRSWTLKVLSVLFLGGSMPGFAQQPTGPATLENLITANETSTPADSDPAPKRPAGTVTRPRDGVQHPDLDKAWADYDLAVANATESIKVAIAKRFEAATNKGDLEAAEKFQAALEKFESLGELPAGTELKAAVVAAVADFKEASGSLSKTYADVKRSLTKEKDLTTARKVSEEADVLKTVKVPDLVSTPVVGKRRLKRVAFSQR